MVPTKEANSKILLYFDIIYYKTIIIISLHAGTSNYKL
jgi:hypothetical protein